MDIDVRFVHLLLILMNISCLFAVLSPRRVRFKELSPSMLSVTWKEPKGQFDGYKLVYITDPGELSDWPINLSFPALFPGELQIHVSRLQLYHLWFFVMVLLICQTKVFTY